MAEHQSDEDQAEALKKWLDENGSFLVVGLVLTLAAVFGFQAWQKGAEEKGEAASTLYGELIEIVDIPPLEKLTDEQQSTSTFLANKLKEEHEGTSYGVFSALHLAKLAIERNDLEAAETELFWALEHATSDSLEHIARQRLARVMLSKGDTEKALKLVEDMDASSFVSGYEEIKGDAYSALGKNNKAREAYQTALDNMVEKTSKPILQMKLSNLPSNRSSADDSETEMTESDNAEIDNAEIDNAEIDNAEIDNKVSPADPSDGSMTETEPQDQQLNEKVEEEAEK